MTQGLQIGSVVQTPLGKGVVLEVRNNSRLLVDVRGRSVELRSADVSVIDGRGSAPRTVRSSVQPAVSPVSCQRDVPLDVDLHGMTVDEALSCAANAVNNALLSNQPQVRFIHGRSGGKIRGALHRWLRGIPAVSDSRLDAHNPGITVVTL